MAAARQQQQGSRSKLHHPSIYSFIFFYSTERHRFTTNSPTLIHVTLFLRASLLPSAS